jgi:hypothetical protein
MLQRSPTRDKTFESAGTKYVLLVALPQGKREVKSFPSMTEAILFRFECEHIILRAGFKCPPLTVELRAGLRREVQP